jgi:NAD-dependent deacetylase
MLRRISRNIVVLTGAGISKESGLDTFRDKDGIWARVRLEDVATPEAFHRDPDAVNAFYNERRRSLLSAGIRPNPAHLALARLEREWRGDVLIVTQNIDDLHERAETGRVIHMHGELLKARCMETGEVFEWHEDITPQTLSPCCGRPGCLRPHVVWFGEIPLYMDEIYRALAECDLFLSIGTSGAVHPAAGFVREARHYGKARAVELNLEPSEGSSLFDETIHGPASKVVPEFIDKLLAEAG